MKRRGGPIRIKESAHVLSISTFQRNRSCCELVQRLVALGIAPPAAADAEDVREEAEEVGEEDPRLTQGAEAIHQEASEGGVTLARQT